MPNRSPCFVGIDFGTSGCRAIAIDEQEAIIAQSRQAYPPSDGPEDPVHWLTALKPLLQALQEQLITEYKIVALSLDGTSGTVLLEDSLGQAISAAKMYNDSDNGNWGAKINQYAGSQSAARGNGSGLARALSLLERHQGNAFISTQASWLAAQLCGSRVACDANNALKLGYDPIEQGWPKWLAELLDVDCMPAVVPVGTVLGQLSANWCEQLNIHGPVTVYAGTTDSCAAFVAAGVRRQGDAVSSLGSTLAVKLLGTDPVFAAEYGVYSHRIGPYWLIGGASNSGGAVLKQHFSDEEIKRFSCELQPDSLLDLDYYPLPQTGERFPYNDPSMAPRLEPRPDQTGAFFQAIIEGITRIEQKAYDRLAKLGAGQVKRIFTAGGGANNEKWIQLRHNVLGVPVLKAQHTEAAYGSALIAKRAFFEQTLL